MVFFCMSANENSKITFRMVSDRSYAILLNGEIVGHVTNAKNGSTHPWSARSGDLKVEFRPTRKAAAEDLLAKKADRLDNLGSLRSRLCD